jgi:hypothetical protein
VITLGCPQEAFGLNQVFVFAQIGSLCETDDNKDGISTIYAWLY